jgi:hypothetical protein
MENKIRYATGLYRPDMDMMQPANRLVAYIVNSREDFNLRRLDLGTEESDKRIWITLRTDEILKAKEAFKNDVDVLEFIDLTQDYDKWKTACVCCNTITLNVMPYTYRGSECIGRVYNCLNCSGLSDRYARKVANVYYKEGQDAVMDFLDVLFDDETYNDPKDIEHCKNCDINLKEEGIIVDSTTIHTSHVIIEDGVAKFDENGNLMYAEGLPLVKTVGEYNDMEIKAQEEIHDYYPNYIEPEYYGDGCKCVHCCSTITEEQKNYFKL